MAGHQRPEVRLRHRGLRHPPPAPRRRASDAGSRGSGRARGSCASWASRTVGVPARTAAMLPWIRVPNTKSVRRMWSIHGHGSTKKTDLSSRTQRVRGVARQRARAVVVGRALAPQQQTERLDVLADVLEVRVALEVVADDRTEPRDPRGDAHPDPGVAVEGRPLGDDQPVAMQEHRRAADDLDVAEPELVEVGLGRLAADADRRRTVEDRPDERLDRVVERADRARRVRLRGLDPDAQDHHRDRQLLDDRGQTDEGLLEARPEGVGEGDDVDVEALVDLVGAEAVRGQPVRDDLRVTRAQDLERRLEEQQVAAVVRDQVVIEDALRRNGVEGALGPPDEDACHPPQDTGRGRPVRHPEGPRRPQASRIAPSWLRIRAVAPQTDSPSTS